MNVITFAQGTDLESLWFRYIKVPYMFLKVKKLDKVNKAIYYDNFIDDFECVCFCIEDITFWKRLSKIKKKIVVSLRFLYCKHLLEYYEYLTYADDLSYSEYEVLTRLKDIRNINYESLEYYKELT